MLRRAAALVLLLWPWAAGCSDPIPDPNSDGNVLISDAQIDAGADSGVTDAGPDAAEVGLDAAEPDATLDAGPEDLGQEEDAGPDGGSLCDEVSTGTFTASVVLSQAPLLDGQVLEVVGTATTTAPVCSRRACPPESPCCNTCTAQVVLLGGPRLIGSACASFLPGCSGDECGLVCRPPVFGVPQTFRGRLVATASVVNLELHRVLP